MSLKAELERWVKALEAYDAQDFSQALSHFEMIADSSKVLFNIGLIHATLGNHKMAVAYYEQAHLLDQYLAVSFFQCGVSHFLMGEYANAERDFSNAYIHMRENQIIDHEQLGLKFRLFSAEILFNRGLSMISQGQQMQGMQLLDQARKEKQTDEHSVIDEAYAEQGRNFTVFSVPVGVLFRPSPIKLKNLKAKNYLGTAKLVAATEASDPYIGFSGTGRRTSPSSSPIDPTQTARKRSQSVTGDAYRPPKPPSPPPTLPLPPPPPPAQPSYPNIQPLRIQKSSPDLKAARPAAQARPQQLPRLDTEIPNPALRAGVSVGQIYPASRLATDNGPMVGSGGGNMIANAMMAPPPSPPESEYDQPQVYENRQPTRSPAVAPAGASGVKKQSRRTSSDTTLIYRNNTVRTQPKRETEFLEELIGGYSATSLSPLQELPPPVVAAAAAPAPTPQGQPRDRVEKWASSQQQVQQQQPTTRFQMYSQRDQARLAPNTQGQNLSTQGTNSSTNSTNRRRAQTDGTGGRFNAYGDFDDAMSARAMDMVSFRLKLHFEDDIRGMSLDVDTSWNIFYARLQGKFGISDMRLKYKDEDGVFVTIVDETDWDSAVDAARENCPKGRQDGKLEIWVSES